MNDNKEFEITKDILHSLKTFKVVKTLNEQGDVISLDQDQIKNEEELIKQTVSNRVKINSINVYPSDRNVLMLGEMLDMNIAFQLSLNDSDGLTIFHKNEQDKLITIDDSSLRNLQKLSGYYQNWKDTWFNEKLDLFIKNV